MRVMERQFRDNVTGTILVFEDESTEFKAFLRELERHPNRYDEWFLYNGAC